MLKKLFGKREVPVVEVASHDLKFEVPRGKTLLEAAQDAGIGFPCGHYLSASNRRTTAYSVMVRQCCCSLGCR